ncbi:hypothetical protein L4C33_09310 [Vibrio makurazakiensis]|uniref:hypothetical protein n=1 Tax=Vibrio makurazakiensis TaxID=2910250 RepID=UPI003D0A0EA8
MNKQIISSLAAAMLSIVGLIYLVVDSSFPVSQWPVQAFNDIVFSLVMGFGVSKYVGYAYSGMLFVGVAVIAYAIGFKLSASFAPQNSNKQER